MLVGEAMEDVANKLIGQVPSPQVESEILLMHVTGLTRATLFAGCDRRLSRMEQTRLEDLVLRRRAMAPLQYLTGDQAFRKIALEVGPGVLVPRPETEWLVEHALGRIEGIEQPVVVDLGTGSGAIALSIAAEAPRARVWGTDISAEALGWANRNRQRLGLSRVELRLGDLCEALPGELEGACHLIVSNPPYLNESEFNVAPPDVREFEPKVALVAGPDGTEISRRIVEEAFDFLSPGGWLVMEAHPPRAVEVASTLERRYSPVAVQRDLAGRERIVEGMRP